MIFNFKLYDLAFKCSKNGAGSVLHFFPVNFCLKFFLKSIYKNDINKIKYLVDDLILNEKVISRILSYYNSRIDTFDNDFLNLLPNFHKTKLAKITKKDALIIKNVLPVNFKENKKLVLWTLQKNLKKKSTAINKKILNTSSYFLKRIDLETDLRFEAANASAIFDDFYSDDTFETFEVDWIKTNSNTLIYEIKNELLPIDLKKISYEDIQKLYHIFYKMVFIKGYYNFDLSIENLAQTTNNKFTFLDYSTCIKLSSEIKTSLTELFLSLLNSDYKQLTYLIRSQQWSNESDYQALFVILEKQNSIFNKFKLFCRESSNFNISLPNEFFLVWLGFNNIQQLSQQASIKIESINEDIKKILLNETQNFFIKKNQKSKFVEFSNEIKTGLQKNLNSKEASKKKAKKLFFKTNEPKCIPRKKGNINIFVYIWFVLFILIFVLLLFKNHHS